MNRQGSVKFALDTQNTLSLLQDRRAVARLSFCSVGSMLRAIRKIRDEACKAHRDSETFTLEQITHLIEAYTAIDEIEFIQFPATIENPIWGEFRRWEHFKPYEGEKTYVQIRYASHLDAKWRRFVICKEMCHALDARKGAHTASDDMVSDLITDLSLLSAESRPEDFVDRLPIQAEKVAEAGAMELLVPLHIRKELLQTGEFERLGVAVIAERFRVPDPYIELVFRPAYMDIVSTVL